MEEIPKRPKGLFSKKGFTIFLIVLILILYGYIKTSYYGFEEPTLKFSSNNPRTILNELVYFANNESYDFYYKFEKDSESDAYVSEIEDFRWRTEEGYSVKANGFITGAIESPNSVDPKEGLASDYNVRYFVDSLSGIFEDNLFIKDINNSSIDYTGLPFYDYSRSYVREEVRCQIQVLSDLSPSGRIQTEVKCSNKVDEAISQQLGYLKALEKFWEEESPDSKFSKENTFVEISKEADKYFNMIVSSYPGGGYLVVGMKKGDDLEILYSFQDYILCESIDGYEIPKEVYENCYENCDDEYNCRLRFEE